MVDQWHAVALKGYTADGDPLIEGYGVVFGGEDLYGETFTKETDFWFKAITDAPPVLYQHGQDRALTLDLVGKAKVSKVDEVGVWFEAQIEKANRYKDAVLDLVKAGKLGWSTGSVPHLVRRAGTVIKSWPVVELSLTPEPAEPRTFAALRNADAAGLRGTDNTTRTAPDATKAMSFEEIRGAIDGALTRNIRAEPGESIFEYVHQTYPGYAIVCRNTEGTSGYFKVPYLIEDDRTVKLGEYTEVEQQFVPVKSLSPFQAFHDQAVAQGAACRHVAPVQAPAATPGDEPPGESPDEPQESVAEREAKAAIDAYLAAISLPRR
ncbi:MAG: HK97 family phage prohead protease [Dehalococcoidia bacterium]